MATDGQVETPPAPDPHPGGRTDGPELAPATRTARWLVRTTVGLAILFPVVILLLMQAFAATFEEGGTASVPLVALLWIDVIGLLVVSVANVVVAVRARHAHRRSRANWIAGLIPLVIVVAPVTALWAWSAWPTVQSWFGTGPPGLNQPIEVGFFAEGIAADRRGVWVANSEENTVSHVDPRRNRVVATIRVGEGPRLVALGAGSVWVTNNDSHSISRIDPATNRVIATIRLHRVIGGITYGAGSIWITNDWASRVSRIDPATNTVTAEIPTTADPTTVSWGAGSIWVSEQFDSTIERIDPTTDTVVDRVHVRVEPAFSTFGAGSLWLIPTDGRYLTRLDATTGRQWRLRIARHGNTDLTYGRGRVWVSQDGDQRIVAVNPRTNSVTRTIGVGDGRGEDGPGALALEGRRLWVVIPDSDQLDHHDV